jgi:uncharacterized membrane protein YkoI
MKLILCACVALSAVLTVPLMAQESETKVQMKDLPPAVQAAVKEQSKDATLKGLTKEVESGATRYEAELRVKGRTRDVTFDETGKILSVEQEVPLATIPMPARDAIQKSIGKGKLLLVETVTEGSTTLYEAHIRSGGKEIEVEVDANGQPVK